MLTKLLVYLCYLYLFSDQPTFTVPAQNSEATPESNSNSINNRPSELYELIPDSESDSPPPEHTVVLLDPWWEAEYMGVAVGALVTVILILIGVIVFIVYKNHASNAYYPPGPDRYYDSHSQQQDPAKAVGGGGVQQWETHSSKFASPRKLPPTPLEANSYREYTSPLINTNLRHYQQQQQQQQHHQYGWREMLPPPSLTEGTLPSGRGSPLVNPYATATTDRTLTSGRGSPVVNHYAATDLLGGKVDRKSGGNPYFL